VDERTLLLTQVLAHTLSPEQLARLAKGKAAPNGEHFSEGSSSLRGVDVFAAGTHRGKTYTEADLDDMARNFERASTGKKPGFAVPLVIGHEESQEFLERSDLPAAGWATRVWRDGPRLKADFDDVPPNVARLLRGKTYRTVSSEVYDEPPEGVPNVKGKMLRRVALLGGDIPQVKSLDDIPAPEPHAERFARYWPTVFRFSEARARPLAGTFFVFSEVSPMDRDEMMQHLEGEGWSREVLDKMPDEALAEAIRVNEDQGQNDDRPGDEAAFDDDMARTEPDQFDEESADDEEKRAEYAERARKYAAFVKQHAERARRYMERFCSQEDMADAPVSTESGMGGEHDDYASSKGHQGEADPDQVAAAMAQMRKDGTLESHDEITSPQPKKTTVTHQYSENGPLARFIRRQVSAVLNGQVKKKMDRFEKFTEEQLASQKRATIDAFCETQLKLGKILPAELDADNPANLRDRLLRADAKTPVRKFKEGKKEVALTELDLQMREIESRPPMKFGERFKQPQTKGKGAESKPGKSSAAAGNADDDAEAEKVRDTVERFSEKFPRGTRPEVIVAGFKAERKHNAELTAEEFLEGLAG
jgi:hypothetical protein